MEKRQEFGHYVIHLISYEHLIAIQLNLIALQVNVLLNLGEVKHTRKIERIIHIKVNPEKGFIRHGIKVGIELLVIFIRKRRGSLCPERCRVVYNIEFFGFHLLTILPFLLKSKCHGHSQEAAIL